MNTCNATAPTTFPLIRNTERALFFVFGIASINLLMSLVNTSNQPTKSVNTRSYGDRALRQEDTVVVRPYQTNSFYTHRRLSSLFGIEALGIDLNDESLLTEHKDNFIAQLKQDLIKHRAVLFRAQNLSGDRQVEISKALGDLLTFPEYPQHPKSPHPLIYRVSNNVTEGFKNPGVGGWHNDGTHQTNPFVYLTMYFPSVAKAGNTHLMPLKELLDSFSPEEKKFYSKLWSNSKYGGEMGRSFHPLVYKHPLRVGEETMLFSLGGGKYSWQLDEDDDDDVSTTKNVTDRMRPVFTKTKLQEYFDSKLDTFGVRMKWEKGDFLVFDNVGLSHHVSQDVTKKADDVGLRILHRTSISWPKELLEERLPTKTDGRKSFQLDGSKLDYLKSKLDLEMGISG